MLAAVIHKYGKPDVFKIETVSEPVPRADEVKIRVIASSVNPIDYRTRSGSLFFISGWRFPRILGADFSGIITECGSQVKNFKVGDEVCGFTNAAREAGAHGEFMCCKADIIALKPKQLTFQQAAAFPLAGLTALQALYNDGKMVAGMHVLITGATGGVGHFAVQIAKAAGCHVIGVCHSRNTELALQLGCNAIIAYDKQDYRKVEQRYDLIFDAAAKFGYWSNRRVLKPKGIYVSTVPSIATLISTFTTGMSTGRKGRIVMAKSRPDDLEILGKLCEQGRVIPVIEHSFPLAQIVDAHILIEANKVRGKIVINTGD